MTEVDLKTLIKSCVKTLLKEGLLGMNQRELRDILHLNRIINVSDKDEEASVRKIRNILYSTIQKRYPWMLEYQYPSKREGSHGGWYAPFAQFFTHQDFGYDENWLHDFCRELIRETTRQEWESEHSKDIKTFDKDLKAVYQYASDLHQLLASNPLNPKNYPLYVSAYNTTREYGGPEEGGWQYTWNEHIRSIQVNNYKEARAAALKLLKENHKNEHGNYYTGLGIYLEKISGSMQSTSRPHYS